MNLKQLKSKLSAVVAFSVLLLLIASGNLKAQAIINTPNPPFLPNQSFSGRNFITFVIENTNNVPYNLNQISTYVIATDNNAIYRLYCSTTNISGPGNVYNDFTLIATSGTNPVVAPGYDVLPFAGLNFQIPANTQYRFALTVLPSGISGSVGTISYADFATPNYFTNDGIVLKVGDYQINGLPVGYQGSMGSATNPNGNFTATQQNKFWCGGIVMNPAPACTSPPVPGTVTVSPSTSVCPNTSVTLSLAGNSTGAGMTYRWQSAPVAAGPYTNLGPAQNNSTFNYTSVPGTVYYRCILSCSGIIAPTSPQAVTTSNYFPGGTYTINSAIPTGGTNFQSFSEAAAAVSCGISGPVVFNVDAASGPYTEQFTLPATVQTTSTNTITFNGNGRTIGFGASGAPDGINRAVIKLDGADWIRINDLIINCSTGTFGWGVFMTNNADNNIISGCDINANINWGISGTFGSNFNFTPIVLCGSPITATTNGPVNGHSGNNNLITGCLLKGGNSGVIVMGLGTGPFATNNQIINNTIEDGYSNGVSLNNALNTVISGNNIQRLNKTAASMTTGFYAGITLSLAQNTLIEKNRIHDSFNLNQTGNNQFAAISLNSGTLAAGLETKIINNTIYNIKNLGAQSGIASSGSPFKAYHNTIVLDHVGIPLNVTTAGINLTSSAAGGLIDIKNNIIVVTRKGSNPGTGSGTIKLCIYNSFSVSTFNSDYNVFYVDPLSGGTNAIAATGSFPNLVPYTTLTNWQAANSGAWDQHSINVSPAFTNLATGDLTPIPTDPTNIPVNNSGTPVGTTTDILNASRSTSTPDPGAYEFTVPGTDAGITWTSPLAPTAAGPNKVVSVLITNNMTTVINSLTMNYTAYGVTSANQIFSGLNLLPGASTILSFAQTFNFTTTTTVFATIVTADDNIANNTTAIITLCPAMSGTYTIDQTPASGADFSSIASAISALNCGGVAGPVVFNVITGTGPYVEQLEIFPVNGASATNTITFNGNSNVIGDVTTTTALRHVFKLNGADHFVINGFTVKCDLATQTFGWGFWLTNNADNNTISNCTINLSLTSTTFGNYVGIAMSASSAGATSNGDNGSNNLFIGNTFNGGFFGITVTGPITTPFSSGNQAINNIFNNTHDKPFQVINSNNPVFSGNIVQRPIRTTSASAFSAVIISGSLNSRIENNIIRDLYTSITNSGFLQATVFQINSAAGVVGQEHEIINNLISFRNGNGSLIGIQIQGFANAKIYHNTISFDDPAAVTTASTNTRGIELQSTFGAALSDVRNNIITINRGGAGPKSCIHIGATYMGGLDFNNYYNSSTGGPSNFIGFYTAGTTTLAQWQATRNFTWDMNSSNVDPFYQNVASNNYIPMNILVNNTGTNVGVTTDLDGGPARSLTTPDIGAYEFSPPSIDIGPVALASPNASGCYSSTQEISVTIKNWGTDPVDFSVTPGTVTCVVSGPAGGTFTGSPTGILNPGATMDVLLTGTINMTVFGNYSFAMSATCNGDGIALNNTIPAVTRTSGFTVGTISAFPPNTCGNSQTTLTLNNSFGGSIQWEKSLVSASGPWSPVGTGLNTYTDIISQTTYFQATVSCLANTGIAPAVTVNTFDPQTPTPVTPPALCTSGSALLQASVPGTSIIRWYDSNGFLVGTGPSVNTPVITSTSTFYVAGASPGNTGYNVGKSALGIVTATSANPEYLIFDAFSDFVLNSVVVYPFGFGAGGNGTVTIALQNSSGVTLQTATATVNANSNPVNPQTATLNFNIPAGANYRLVLTGVTAPVVNLYRDAFSVSIPNGVAFPYTVPGVMSIKSSSFGNSNYFYFYNWNISAPCESPRIPVVAQVIPGPADQIVASDDEICSNESVTISSNMPADNNKSYSWSSTPAGFSQNGVGPYIENPQVNTTYTLTVTDLITSCTSIVNRPVIVRAAPVPTAFSNSPVCENQDILLFASDGLDFTWSGPDNFYSEGLIVGEATVSNAQAINAGDYTVTVTNGFGCVSSETINVVVNDNPEPYLVSTSDATCTGFSDGEFMIGVNGGTPFFSFNDPGLGQNFTGLYTGVPAGTYYVEVTDINQCVSVMPVEVTVGSVPNAAPVISCPANITVNSTPGLCGAIVNFTPPQGTDVCPIIGTTQIAGLPSGWTFPVGTTVNTFRVTDVEGLFTDCSFSVTVTETEAPTIANCPANFSSCNPVSWTPPVITDNCPGVQIAASHTPGTFPAGVTTVTYTAIDVYNNTSTCSFDITRLEESVAASGITSDRDHNNICTGESIVLTINGGTLGDNAMWKWYTGTCGGSALPAFNGMTTITVSPTATTTYFARAEGSCNTTGCVSITVDVSTAGPPSGLAITSMPAFGAAGVTGTVTCTPVPGATFYRWSSILGHIDAIWFPNTQGPVETTVPSVNVLFNQSLQNYQIRVVAGNACGRTNNASAHIRGTVPATTCLAGPALACPNTTATYSVATCEIPGTNGYQWTVGPNMTITTGQGTNTITVTFGAGFTNGQVCVNGVSQFGLGGPQTCLNISNNTAAPGPITGNDEPCQSGLETYTIAAVPGASSYIWSTDIIGAIAGGTTETGTVQFPTGSFSGNVCVQAVSSCGISSMTCFAVTSGAAGNPGPILGSTTGICGATVNYALGTNDANSYNWILPAGVTLVSTNGANSVQVAFPSTPGQHVISVEAFYNCGSATSGITVDGAPGAPTVTPLTICAGSDETYIASATGADSYSWTTTGALYESCTNGSCSNFYVIWDVAGASFTVEAVNACGTSPSFTLNQNCRISDSGEMETKVYPNPTTGQLTVEFTSERGGAYSLTVTDMAGRNIFNQDVTASSGMNTQRIDLENANPGMYMLYIRDAQRKISVTKVTKE